MKEATGELNMTVITVVAIAAIAAIFYAFIWPSIQKQLLAKNACSASGGQTYTDSGKNYTVNCGNGKCTVTYNNKSYETTCNQQQD